MFFKQDINPVWIGNQQPGILFPSVPIGARIYQKSASKKARLTPGFRVSKPLMQFYFSADPVILSQISTS
jgi:hypothetical protein